MAEREQSAGKGWVGPSVPRWTPGAPYVVGSAYVVGRRVVVCTSSGVADAGPATDIVDGPAMLPEPRR